MFIPTYNLAFLLLLLFLLFSLQCQAIKVSIHDSPPPSPLSLKTLLHSSPLSSPPHKTLPAKTLRNFFHISDIHYDPLADPSKFNSSTFCRPSSEEVQHNGKHNVNDDATIWDNGPGEFGRYGCDTPGNLLSSVLSAMREVNPHPDFILYTGDSPAHNLDFQTQQQAIEHVADSFAYYFPDTLIIPSVGNEDFYPDYTVSCADSRLAFILNAFDKWIPVNQSLSFITWGGYTLSPSNGLRVIILNTVLYSVRNSPGLGNDPCNQLSWLKGQLDDARQNGVKVYLTAHIFPGMDPELLTPLWYPNYSSQFIALVLDYSDVIYGSFFGHTHRDEFRILNPPQGSNLDAAQNASILAASSISPIYDNNPSFRLYYYDSTSLELTDYDEYYMDLALANQLGVANWTLEYTYSDSYRQSSISTSALVSLFTRLKNEPTLFTEWYARRVGQYVDSKQTALCILNSPDAVAFSDCMEENSV